MAERCDFPNIAAGCIFVKIHLHSMHFVRWDTTHYKTGLGI